jgi:hypothetical protein
MSDKETAQSHGRGHSHGNRQHHGKSEAHEHNGDTQPTDIRQDLLKILNTAGEFLATGRRPYYINDGTALRLQNAFEELVDDILDEDDTVDDDTLDDDDALEKIEKKVILLRRVAGV